MNIILQVDTSSIEVLTPLRTPIQVFVHGLVGVFLFTLFFILFIKIVSYCRKRIEKNKVLEEEK
ncbi:MAG: hypothetical protein FWH36_00125 [Lentimicrobiaceae bacterium]|nr:hypothetical protein [Lentimicrobiaceae bacterium]